MSDQPVAPTQEPITTAQRHIKAIKERCGSVVLAMHCDKALEALDMAPQSTHSIIARILAHLDARAVGWDESKGEFKPYEFGAQHEARALAAQVREIIADHQPEQRIVTCVYCGQAYPDGTATHGAQVLTDHIKTCASHPMRQAEADIDRLKRRVAELENHIADIINIEVPAAADGLKPMAYMSLPSEVCAVPLAYSAEEMANDRQPTDGMVELFTKAQLLGTPSATWRADGEPDPHGKHYDCERAALCMGNLTDDQLANAAFLNYDVRPPLQDIIAGKAHMPIAYMTAVKDRIRWLSRRLEAAREDCKAWFDLEGKRTNEALSEKQRAETAIRIGARLAGCLWDYHNVCPECGDSELSHMASCKQTYAQHFTGPQDAEPVFRKVFGFDEPETPWQRDTESVFCTLLLINETEGITREAVTSWSDDECRAAQDWAAAVHLHAGDHADIAAPPMPACVKSAIGRAEA